MNVTDDLEPNLTQTMDAQIWAEEWMKTIRNHPTVPYSKDTMIGWFANAIMAGYDAGRRHEATEMDERKFTLSEGDYIATFENGTTTEITVKPGASMTIWTQSTIERV